MTRPQKAYSRISPALRARIQKLAREGWAIKEIARDCCISPTTANRWASQVIPAPDYHLHLTETDLRHLRELAELVVHVACPHCRILAIGLRFLPATTCQRCGQALATPPENALAQRLATQKR